jgi:hypothetical protein
MVGPEPRATREPPSHSHPVQAAIFLGGPLTRADRVVWPITILWPSCPWAGSCSPLHLTERLEVGIDELREAIRNRGSV